MDGMNVCASEGSWRRSGIVAVSLQRSPERSLAQLKVLIAALKTRNEESRQEITGRIKTIVGELRKGSPDEFSRLMQEVNQTIFKLVQEEPMDLWAGIGAISALLDVVDPTAAQLAQLGNYTRLALRNADKSTIVAASRTLGRLAKKGGVLTAEHIEREAKKALETLSERDVRDVKLYAAVLVVKELALNVPALFFPYVEKCIKPIWTAIRDSNMHVREAGCVALKAFLTILSTHAESHVNASWYNYVWEQCKNGLKSRDASLNHGALLCVGDVFNHTGPFLYDKFPETYCIVFALRDNSNLLVRLAVLRTIPTLAWYARADFRMLYMVETLQFLYTAVKRDTKEERIAALATLAELSAAAGTAAWKPHCNAALQAVKIVIERKSKFTPEALPTYATLAALTPPEVEKEIADFIDPLYAGGVSYHLAEALDILLVTFPALKHRIQAKLLDALSKALTGHSHTGSDTSPPRFDDIHRALRILRTFDFHPRDLSSFVRDTIIKFLDDESPVVRKEAALTCAAIVVPHRRPMVMSSPWVVSGRSKSRSRSPSMHVQPPKVGLVKISDLSQDWSKDAATTRGHKGILVGEVVERLLSIAVADPDPQIRLAIFSSLDGRFANHLTTVDSLRFLLMATNDEGFAVRKLVTGIVAKLAPLNPSHVLPYIRKQLLQLLTQLEHTVDHHTQNESLQLLTILIQSAPEVMSTYAQSIVDVIKLRLNEFLSDSDVAVSLFGTISATAEAVGEKMLQYMHSFLPVIIAVLKGRSSAAKLNAALVALGCLVQFTGHVIKPYEEYPELLPILFSILKSDTCAEATTLREVMKVLGIIGALDPFRRKLLEIERREAAQGESLSIKSEGHHTKVVLTNLVVIMNDVTLQTYHKTVVQVVVNICRSTQGSLSQILPTVLPPFLAMLRQRGPDTDLETTKYFLGQLSALVPLCGPYIKQYLSEMHCLITTYFNKEATLSVVLHLIADLSVACPADFKAYLPPLLPRVLIILKNDALPDETVSLRCLKILSCLGEHLNEFLYQVVPTLMELVSHEGADLPPYYQGLQSAALKTLRRIGKVLHLEDYASTIIHPLLRVMTRVESTPLRADIMGVMCMMVHQLGSDYAMFIPIVHKAVTSVHYTHGKYSSLIEKLLKNQVLPAYNTLAMDTAEVRYLNELLSVPLEEVPSQTDDEVKMREAAAKPQVNQKAVLKSMWEASNVVTRDGWAKWFRSFSLELLQQSPYIALKLSANLASQFQPFARDLFNTAFVSVWCNIRDTSQEQMCVELEGILTNNTLPPEALGTLLNLIELMDAHDLSMPIDPQLLSDLATKTSALAKTLRWKEIAFQISPQVTIEGLVTIYNQLGHTHSALGLLHVAEKSIDSTNKESWYERLEKWELALDALEKEREKLNNLKVPDGGARLSISSTGSSGEDVMYAYFQKVTEIDLRMMRCLHALGEWKQLHEMSKASWNTISSQRSIEQEEEDEGDSLQHAIAPLATAAAWRMGDWDFMVETVEKLPANSYDYFFHKAIMSLKVKDDETCRWAIGLARDRLAKEMTSLVTESYERGYKCLVQAQQLSEIEEIQLMRTGNADRCRLIKSCWLTRLKGCTNSVQHWGGILQVRSLLLDPVNDSDTWLKFTSLCRNQGKHKLEKKTLQMLLGHHENSLDPEVLLTDVGRYNPRVTFAYFKHLWAVGSKKPAYSALGQLVAFLKMRRSHSDEELLARCCLKLGDWSDEVGSSQQKAMDYYREAMFYDQKWYRAWHAWALANQNQIQQGGGTVGSGEEVQHITAAINGYIKSITLGPSHASVLQDILRLLTLWFLHGSHEKVEKALSEGINIIKLDVWLLVIPQIIARVHTKDTRVAGLVAQLLRRIGKEFPQSLVYPLTVCARSTHADRKQAASQILAQMREHSAALVEQCEFVSNELIRVAIIWHEMWHLGIEEASKQFFGSKDVEGMLRSLFPLHNMMKKTETVREVSFIQAHGRDLEEAFEWCQSYLRTGDEQSIHQAWELYYSTYKKLRKVIPVDYTTLELQYCSPRLVMAKDLDITVPGLPSARTAIRIHSFHPQMEVMLSKQRPRKMTIHGSDGKQYKFLLKGHEDLRLDERVMQLFGLVNALLQSDSATAMKTALQIQRYPVIPLSSNVGLIGWVDNTDTLHSLVKEFREKKKMRINVEYQHMVQLCYQQEQAYEHLPLINKVELFEYMMENTTGQDLYKILWLQSGTAEVWIERRTTYTLSLATMSMVGYILGLGDRHPNNLMLQRVTGKVVHIDFGDCFEVAMLREKFPEKIPFRLTRMLRGAMEVSGIEGNFRHACHGVMRVQREHKGSVMAMLEAFVHDPLLQWRILRADKGKEKPQDAESKNATMRKNIISEYIEHQFNQLGKDEDAMPPRKDRAEDEKQLMAASVRGDEGVIANQEPTGSHKGVQLLKRIDDKLNGKDFGRETPEEGLDVENQVDRLINQAMSVENLCQCYIGWCPFW